MFNKKKLLSDVPLYNGSIGKPSPNYLLIENYQVNFHFVKVFLRNQLLQYPCAFKIYKLTCKVEVLDSGNPPIQLFAIKPCVKDLLKELSAKMRGLEFRKRCTYVFCKKRKNSEIFTTNLSQFEDWNSYWWLIEFSDL